MTALLTSTNTWKKLKRLTLALLFPLASFAQANDLCTAATPLVSSTTCTNVGGSLLAGTTFTASAGIVASCANNTRKDVWYSFVAKTTNPTITLSSVTFLNPRMTLFAGSCAALTGSQCGTTSIVSVGLTVGATYLVRVYSNTDAPGTFNICVQDPIPANDLCGGAIALTPGVTCSNITGNLYGATVTTPTTSPCSGTVTYDVWYTFVANSVNPEITLSNLGSDVTGAKLQLFSGTCGAPVSLECGAPTVIGAGLTVGTTYRVRVFGTGTLPTTGLNAGFSICVVSPPPPNDDCTGAITLPVNAGCSNTYGTVVNSTASGVSTAPCGGVSGYDVWYKFVAVATTATVSLDNFGANYLNHRFQIFSGSCATPGVALYCQSGGGSPLSQAATGLTIGNTYYIRVFSSTATAPTTNGDFTICVSTATANIPPRFGNSYVNITKQTTGGVVENGDILEIRMAIYYSGSTNLFRPRYLDNIPTNTAIQAGSGINIITNEGVVMQTYTQTAGDDAATYIASPTPGYNIRLNVGFGAGFLGGVPGANTVADLGGTATSRMISTDLPRASGSLLFATAFRVQVTGTAGQTITLGAGKFVYRTGSAAGTELTLNTTPYQILISTPQSLCANATGVNNAAEYGGTFGAGPALNRATDLAAPIGGYTFVQASTTQAIGDGQYGIVKNMSPRNGTNSAAAQQPTCGAPPLPNDNCNNRMFNGFWDVLGDHTGTSTSTGNAPPAVNVDGGYMLLVNSDNIPSIVYQQSLSNLCPNTYYEFSAWVKNVCSVCGVNSAGTQTYVPGVNPNLTFVLDGVDRYSTGEVAYANGWTKKGFVFTTATGQTSMNFAIRTNSQGGGGNDWAIDDISVATCLPNMTYTPTLNPTVCEANSILLNNTIGSYFNNYRFHQWQRSVDGGLTWIDLGVPRDSTPVYNSGTNSYEYLTSYTVPPANTSVADSGDLYRVLVATTLVNLANVDCRVTDGVSFINLKVIDCTPILKTDLLSFNGKLTEDFKSILTWSTTREESALTYQIERSYDGRNFTQIGSLTGYNNGDALNKYTFTDLAPVTAKVWYRIAIVTVNNKKKYSSIIQLKKGTSTPEFDFGTVINPFNNNLSFDIVASQNSTVTIHLVDMSGKVVRTRKQIVYGGTNSLNFNDTQSLQSGIYTLRVVNQDKIIYRRVMKLN